MNQLIEIIGGTICSSMSLSLEDLKKMRQKTLRNVTQISQFRGFRGMHDFRGVPLQDVILKAGLPDEPGRKTGFFFIAISEDDHSEDDYCAVMTHNEIFNTAIGDRIVLATHIRVIRNKKNKPINQKNFECLPSARLIFPDDEPWPDGRWIKDVKKIYINQAAEIIKLIT